jgi:sensor histidine kinase YesM
VNLLPVYGVIFLNWNPFDVILLYWTENIIVGVFNFLRILFAQGKSPFSMLSLGLGVGTLGSFAMNLGLGIFFLFHYGIFTFVHGIFLNFLIFPKTTFFLDKDFSGLGIFMLALTISHGFSFLYNYIGKKEYLERNVQQQMTAPYGRIVVIHLTIILGGFVSTFLPNYSIIIFIIIKIIVDLGAHMRAHTNVSGYATRGEQLGKFNVNHNVGGKDS